MYLLHVEAFTGKAMGLEEMKPGKRTLPWSGLEVATGNTVLEVCTQGNGVAEL